MTEQDLADRLEKALNLLRVTRNGALENFHDAWKFDKARYDLADLIWTADNGQMILASLRALAPAPADQSDAGRDGVIEECARIAEDHQSVKNQAPMGALSNHGEEIAAKIRALASAPSETPKPPGQEPEGEDTGHV